MLGRMLDNIIDKPGDGTGLRLDLLTFATVLLGLTLLLGAYAVWDTSRLEPHDAQIVAVQGETCRYTWTGEPAPDPDGGWADCPPGAAAGMTVPVQVATDGSVWLSTRDFLEFRGKLPLVGLGLCAVLLPTAILRRRREIVGFPRS